MPRRATSRLRVVSGITLADLLNDIPQAAGNRISLDAVGTPEVLQSVVTRPSEIGAAGWFSDSGVNNIQTMVELHYMHNVVYSLYSQFKGQSWSTFPGVQ